jgi:hypothetical protein
VSASLVTGTRGHQQGEQQRGGRRSIAEHTVAADREDEAQDRGRNDLVVDAGRRGDVRSRGSTAPPCSNSRHHAASPVAHAPRTRDRPAGTHRPEPAWRCTTAPARPTLAAQSEPTRVPRRRRRPRGRPQAPGPGRRGAARPRGDRRTASAPTRRVPARRCRRLAAFDLAPEHARAESRRRPALTAGSRRRATPAWRRRATVASRLTGRRAATPARSAPRMCSRRTRRGPWSDDFPSAAAFGGRGAISPTISRPGPHAPVSSKIRHHRCAR